MNGGFRVIPVLDVRNGQAVHAVGGVRSHYRPLGSILHASSRPLELARAYRDSLGLQDLYLADLDAISTARPDRELYRDLEALALNLWIDAGLRTGDDAEPLLSLPRVTVVVGLETASGPESVREILDRAGPDRVVVSLDLFNQVPRLPSSASWSTVDPFGLARQVVSLGARHLLLLDLARVGTGRGANTGELMKRLLDLDPDLQISVGGGIAGIDDIVALDKAGCASVLVGSALHDGRIGRAELDVL